MYIRLTKSCDPNLGSFLDYMTMIASDTTLTNASDIDATINSIATGKGSSKSATNMINRPKNYKTPIINK
jgi:hypothetical protein